MPKCIIVQSFTPQIGVGGEIGIGIEIPIATDTDSDNTPTRKPAESLSIDLFLNQWITLKNLTLPKMQKIHRLAQVFNRTFHRGMQFRRERFRACHHPQKGLASHEEVNPPYPELVNEDADPEIPGSRGKEKRWMHWWETSSRHAASIADPASASVRPMTPSPGWMHPTDRRHS
jgi:hypothetical protein